MLISLYTTLIVTFFAEICVYGLVARQGDPIVSGFYTIWAISTAGFPIGVIPGSFVGVENSTDPSPVSTVLFNTVHMSELQNQQV